MDNEITIKVDKDGKLLSILSNPPLSTVMEHENGETTYHINNLKIQSDLEENPWPQEGDEYWAITFNDSIVSFNFENSVFDESRKKMGNFFKTKEEAQMYSLRIESLSKGVIFDKNTFYWVWDFQENEPTDLVDKTILPKFPTKEECQEWYDQFGQAWLFLLNNNKKS